MLPDGAAAEGVRLYMSAGAVGRGGLGSLLPGTCALWLPGNQIGDAGASALGTAFAVGGLPQLTTLNLERKCVGRLGRGVRGVVLYCFALWGCCRRCAVVHEGAG